MLFFKLINSSFRRNDKVYGPYLLATSMLVAINYIFAAIGINHSLRHLASSSAITAMINISANFILLVTFAFLLYVNRFLWQQRSSELGLYSMLGMTSRNLDFLTVIEKIYLFVGSIVCGLVTGVIFERLAFLGLGRLLKVHNLKQPWIEPAALGKTVLYMAGFFIVLMIVDLVKLHRLNPNQLWHATAPAPKRHGWLFKLLGLLGIIMLAGAYYITLTTKPRISAFSNFMTAVLLVVAGTYLLFIAASSSSASCNGGRSFTTSHGTSSPSQGCSSGWNKTGPAWLPSACCARPSSSPSSAQSPSMPASVTRSSSTPRPT